MTNNKEVIIAEATESQQNTMDVEKIISKSLTTLDSKSQKVTEFLTMMLWKERQKVTMY